jgi:hypothetical protein
MATSSHDGTRWQLARDVVVFQVKCGLEAVLDVTLIPISMAAAALDLVLGHWRRPRLFHAVLRFGERCEGWIDLWGVGNAGRDERPAGVDALMQNIEAVVRDPRTGPQSVRMLRRWAAMKLAGDDSHAPPPLDRKDDGRA